MGGEVGDMQDMNKHNISLTILFIMFHLRKGHIRNMEFTDFILSIIKTTLVLQKEKKMREIDRVREKATIGVYFN